MPGIFLSTFQPKAWSVSVRCRGKEGTEIDTHNAKGWEAIAWVTLTHERWRMFLSSFFWWPYHFHEGDDFSDQSGYIMMKIRLKWSQLFWITLNKYQKDPHFPSFSDWNLAEPEVKGQCMKKWPGYCREERCVALLSGSHGGIIWRWRQDEQCKTISHAKGESGDPTYVRNLRMGWFVVSFFWWKINLGVYPRNNNICAAIYGWWLAYPCLFWWA